MFPRGCSDPQDQLFCLCELTRIEPRLENIFSMGINCMPLSVWLGEGQEMFCGCSRFRVGVRAIYGHGGFSNSKRLNN